MVFSGTPAVVKPVGRRHTSSGGTAINVIWATLAWNTKKITHLARVKGERLTRKAMPLAA